MSLFGVVWTPGIDGNFASAQYDFEKLMQSIERHVLYPLVLRPGLVGFSAQGAVRHVGGIDAFAENVVEQITEDVGCEVHIGISELPFASILAAYENRIVGDPSVFIRRHCVDSFLIMCFTDGVRQLVEPMLETFETLGIHTIGDFLSIDRSHMLSRFGKAAALCYSWVDGRDIILPPQRRAEERISVVRKFSVGIDNDDRLTFVTKEIAQELIDHVVSQGVSARVLGIRAGDEEHERYREWSITHVRLIDIVNRVRCQIKAWSTQEKDVCTFDFLELSAHELYPAGKQIDTLWRGSNRASEYSENSVLKIQSLLGEDSVYVPRYMGSRLPNEAFRLVEWRKKDIIGSSPERPWPGSIPRPWPVMLLAQMQRIEIIDQWGHDCCVTFLGKFSCPYHCANPRPVYVRVDEHRLKILDWAGPWLYAPSWCETWESPGCQPSFDTQSSTNSEENTATRTCINSSVSSWIPHAVCEIVLENGTAFLCVRTDRLWKVAGEY